MTYKYQVTLFCTTGQYRPVSSIVTVNQDKPEDLSLKDTKERKQIIKQGITNICIKRNWRSDKIKEYSYLKVKIRKLI